MTTHLDGSGKDLEAPGPTVAPTDDSAFVLGARTSQTVTPADAPMKTIDAMEVTPTRKDPDPITPTTARQLCTTADQPFINDRTLTTAV